GHRQRRLFDERAVIGARVRGLEFGLARGLVYSLGGLSAGSRRVTVGSGRCSAVGPGWLPSGASCPAGLSGLGRSALAALSSRLDFIRILLPLGAHAIDYLVASPRGVIVLHRSSLDRFRVDVVRLARQ